MRIYWTESAAIYVTKIETTITFSVDYREKGGDGTTFHNAVGTIFPVHRYADGSYSAKRQGWEIDADEERTVYPTIEAAAVAIVNRHEATRARTPEENRATIVEICNRIADLTPIVEDRKECVQEFAAELDRMVKGYLPYDAGTMLGTLDRIRIAATEAQDALQEIETAKVALAEMEWGPEDMAAIDPNNHPMPPREFPAMGEEDWAEVGAAETGAGAWY
jgi:hypothetical protein